MRVAGFGVYRFELPLTSPLALGGMTVSRREGLLLELVGEDGASGWGEASPLPGFSRETLDEAGRALLGLAARAAERGETGEPERAPRGTPPSACFGFEAAVSGLRAASSGRMLPEVLAPTGGPGPSDVVGVAALLSGTRERVERDAGWVRRAGYRAVKLKVGGGTPEEDAELSRGVSRRLGGGVALRLDANRAWSLVEAETFVRALEGVPVEYLEEPLASPGELGELARRTGAPLALDESLVGLEPEDLVRHPYARAVVLKPTLLGLHRSLRLAREARRLGMTPVVSAAYESGVGTAVLVALASALGGAPAGLDTYRRLAGDVLYGPLALPSPELDARGLFAVPLAVDRGTLEAVGMAGP